MLLVHDEEPERRVLTRAGSATRASVGVEIRITNEGRVSSDRIWDLVLRHDPDADLS